MDLYVDVTIHERDGRYMATADLAEDSRALSRPRLAREEIVVNMSDASQARLCGACALFRQTYGTWPTQARMAPALLWRIATSLDQRTFEHVSRRLRLRTTTRSFLAVGDASRHLVYGGGKSQITFPDALVDEGLREEARLWLGIVYE